MPRSLDLAVAQGQAVKRGDVLGLVGNTGLAEDADARLHFEVRYNNTPQDPAEWLAR
ncbi:MAG: M23 family metallopeptidase [Myxococcota bacterium]